MPKYMIFVELGKVPAVTHNTLESASREAVRLASKAPDRVVTVLQVLKQIRAKSTVSIEEIIDEGNRPPNWYRGKSSEEFRRELRDDWEK